MPEPRSTSVIAFIDLAGFSASTDVYGDALALAMLSVFEGIVHDALGDDAPLKWIGDEVMLAFDDCESALTCLGTLLSRCRNEPRIPLTRTGAHTGPVIRRGGDVFGATVNIAARLTELAGPGEFLTTKPLADAARAAGVTVEDRGDHRLRSLSNPIGLFALGLAPAVDPRWIDPVCKMHAPLAVYKKADEGKWFCSNRCAEAYARNPGIYEAKRR
ncbi:adenylate/guanylate cyclase domain-containing protein [Alsobacter sp. R-9]